MPFACSFPKSILEEIKRDGFIGLNDKTEYTSKHSYLFDLEAYTLPRRLLCLIALLELVFHDEPGTNNYIKSGMPTP